MGSRKWTEIQLCRKDGGKNDWDQMTAWLTVLGVDSVELLENGKGIRFYLPPSQPSKVFVNHFQKMIQTKFGASQNAFEISFSTLEEKDWMEEWKKGFDVLSLSSHLWICPSWKSFEAPKNSFVINMDPGMAFGTGHHSSTRLMAQAMEDQIYEFQSKKTFPICLDVGTGTGVLSIGAALLGAPKVVALDSDPEALEIAEENIERNHLSKTISIERLPLEKIRRKFDLVLANIIAEVHIQLLPFYIKRLNPGGVLLLSGIIQDRVDMIRAKTEELGWVILNQREQGEWVCFTAIKERRTKRRTPPYPQDM